MECCPHGSPRADTAPDVCFHPCGTLGFDGPSGRRTLRCCRCSALLGAYTPAWATPREPWELYWHWTDSRDTDTAP